MESARKGCCQTLNGDIPIVQEKSFKELFFFKKKVKIKRIKCRDKSEKNYRGKKKSRKSGDFSCNN